MSSGTSDLIGVVLLPLSIMNDSNAGHPMEGWNMEPIARRDSDDGMYQQGAFAVSTLHGRWSPHPSVPLRTSVQGICSIQGG